MSTINNSINSKFENQSDGFDIAGGTPPRKLTVTAGDLTLSAGGANTYTFPASSDTLVGRASTDTLTNKTINASQLVNGTVTPDKLNTGIQVTNVATSETTTSTSYAALATAQSVTVTVGANGVLLIGMSANGFNSSTNATRVAYSLSGANTYSAVDGDAIQYNGTTSLRYGVTKPHGGLSTGSTTVTFLFKVSAGTGTFLNRIFWVVPL